MAANVGVLDFRTAFTGHMMTTALCALVISVLWLRNRDTSEGMGLWVANYWIQFAALTLILLRGAIPDFLSILVANVLVVAGLQLLLVGLARYVEAQWPRLQNYVFLALFSGVHAYFLFAQPNLQARNINSAFALLFLTTQAAWMLARKTSPDVRKDTKMVVFVFAAYAVAATTKLVVDVAVPAPQDVFQSGTYDSLVILLYQFLQVGLSFALVMMVTRRLASALTQDVAEREQAQHALALSESKFATAFRTSPDSVNINRLSDGLYLDINEGFTRLTGYTPEDVIGRTSTDIDIWADPSDRQRVVAGLLSEGVVHNLQAQFRRKDGSITTALMSAQVIDVEGERCILSVTRDITDRIAAEEALRKSVSDLRKAQHFAHVGSWSWDVPTGRLEWSDEMFYIFGVDKETFTGNLADVITEAIHPDDRAAVEESNRSVMEEGSPVPLEYRVVRRDGTERVVWAEAGEMVHDENGAVARLSGTVQDITERKAVERKMLELNEELEMRVQARTEELTATNEELLDANTRLEAATRAKSDFLASMSHELRTPLNSIIGFSDLLAKGMVGDLSAEQDKQIRMINTSGKYLLELVNEVLDLSAIEAGGMRMEYQPVDVTAAVRSVVELLTPLADERGLRMSWEVEPAAANIVSDRTRLEQVLFNIVGNAVKFTVSGGVDIRARRDTNEVVIAVSDTGPGIAENECARIFDEFYQVERRDVAKSEGTGLGLTVSKRLMDMLGGTLEVESTLGEGSTFVVRLPETHG
ncbi:MAG: hypothetical protein CVT66_04580 [Actinobacteria bacterium HGW-Actinobacteria-6]|nr:MAG: hypothetical protein CVT66_04580 [Actinobacteria bacterium HGW-Actinobacteria-6]